MKRGRQRGREGERERGGERGRYGEVQPFKRKAFGRGLFITYVTLCYNKLTHLLKNKSYLLSTIKLRNVPGFGPLPQRVTHDKAVLKTVLHDGATKRNIGWITSPMVDRLTPWRVHVHRTHGRKLTANEIPFWCSDDVKFESYLSQL